MASPTGAKPRRETLSFVAALLFPDDEDKHKMDVDASNMDEEWATRPDEVMAYCARCRAALDIGRPSCGRRKEAAHRWRSPRDGFKRKHQ